MKLSDFKIGADFETDSGIWRCTDIGTRVIVAIDLDAMTIRDGSYVKPPYAVPEEIFDEEAIISCKPRS